MPLSLDRPQRVLFYLPMVTNWWFVQIVEPLLRRLAAEGHEVHVLAPAPWCGTGLGPEELARCTDLPDVRWYIMDGPNHPSTRTVPEDAEGLVDFVRSLAPDVVLCRTADHATAARFPGTVRLLMEGRFEPFAPPPRWILLAERPHDYGLVADFTAEQCARLRGLIAPAWERLRQRFAPRPEERAALFDRLGIPHDRPLLLLPLECETDDNFLAMHRVGPRPNSALVHAIAEQVGARATLAVTNHPLNDLHVDADALLGVIAARPNAVLLPPAMGALPATLAIARHADGMLLGDSKTFALAAFFGVPMLRQTRFATGDWLRAYAELPVFLDAVTTGTARAPAVEDAQLWFAQCLLNDAFDATGPQADVLARIARPVDADRWAGALAWLEQTLPALFEAEAATPLTA